MTDPVNKVYRYETKRYAPPLDEFERPMGEGRAVVELRSFKVLRTTPCGVWIENYTDRGERFINLRSRKQYACSTIEEAQVSFLARKERQILILSKQLKDAKHSVSLIEKLMKPKEPLNELDIA